MIPDLFAVIPKFGFLVRPFIFLSILILIIKGRDSKTIEKFKNLRIFIIIFIYELICNFIYCQKAGFGFSEIIRAIINFTYPFLFAVVVAIYIKNYKDLKQITYILMIPLIIQIIFGLIEMFYGSNEIILQLIPYTSVEGLGETYVSSRNILSEIIGTGSRAFHITGTFGHFNRYAYFIIFGPIVMLAMGDSA